MAKEKPLINIVFVGHVDAGKSTTVGRMMFDAGVVSEQAMAKLKEEAQKHGKAGFEFAYIMDEIRESRERGVTIDLAYKKLVTQKFEITVIDLSKNINHITIFTATKAVNSISFWIIR
jgi:elongation factor 1-alpha